MTVNPQEICDDKNGDSAAAACWYSTYQAADRELSTLWPAVLAAARDADSSFRPTPRRDQPSAERDLIAAQRAWVSYRDAECAAEADWAQGGSLESVLADKCLAKKTRERIQQLRQLERDFKEP